MISTDSNETPNVQKNIERCYFEANAYGFLQKRIKKENIEIPVADESKGPLVMKNILEPKGDKIYGKSTKYLAIDCEMDHVSPSIANLKPGTTSTSISSWFQSGMQGCNYPVKVTIINEEGLIVIDTLIRPAIDGVKDCTKI